MPESRRPLSILGFGVMRLPVRMGRIDKDASDRLLEKALEGGVNYLDTAYPYLNGQSEPYLGKFLSERKLRSTVALATKLPHWITPKRADMEKMLSRQLSRLQTDHIDYYLIHNITGSTWNSLVEKDVREFLAAEKKSGRILNAGFSWHGTPEDFLRVVDEGEWDFCQIQYNLLDERRQAGTAGLEYAFSRNLGVIVMEPLRGGRLVSSIPSAAREIWQEKPERSPASWALGWVWNRREVTTLLSGFSEQKHLEETLSIADKARPDMFSAAELQFIGRVRDACKAAGAVDCTSCRYCMPCPFGVSIPEVFDWYNEWKTIRHNMHQRLFYLSTVGSVLSGRSGLAMNCTSCGACLKKCPQSLPIPDLMRTVSAEYEGSLARFAEFLGRIRHRKKSHKNKKGASSNS